MYNFIYIPIEFTHIPQIWYIFTPTQLQFIGKT